jgi:hypothetical protein
MVVVAGVVFDKKKGGAIENFEKELGSGRVFLLDFFNERRSEY